MKQSLLRRVLSVLLCVSLLLGVTVVRPQKAEAFAISASVVASVILIMTACGVSFWASTQGDAESYISQKLGEYLDQLNPSPLSILDWLGITDLGSLFVVLTGGVARFDSNVSNRIFEFVRWFNSEEGVSSGGSVVSNADSGVTYIFNASSSGSFSLDQDPSFSAFTLHFDSYGRNTSNVYSYAVFQIPSDFDGLQVYISQTSHTLNYRFNIGFGVTSDLTIDEPPDITQWYPAFSSFNIPVRIRSNQYLWFGIYPKYSNEFISGDLFFTINDIYSCIGTPASYSISPSEDVSVPDELIPSDVFDVYPSVSLTEGMSVDDASSEIFEGVVSQDGLTSDSSIDTPPLVDLSGIESRLDAIEAALIDLDNAVDSVDGDTSDIQGSIATLLSRASSIQNSISTLNNNLDNVDDNVNDVALAVSGISGKIDNLESDVAGLVGSLGSISQGNSDMQDSIAGLSSAMSALSEDMELVKDALAGLTANDSLVDDVADIKTNTSGLSGFLSSIQYYIERVLDVLSDFFTGFFDNLASAFIDLINSLKAMLLDLFIPDEAFVDAYVADLQFKMDNHFSILSYPFSLLGRFIGESALQAEGDGILSWPDIYEPFSHTLLIHAGSYRLYDVVDEYGPNFYRAYDLYRIVLQGYITFDFISYLYFWFCDVFKMRELDFPNPLEVEE